MIKQAVYGVAGMLCALLAAPCANAQNPTVTRKVCIMAGNATKSITVMPPNSTLADCHILATTYERQPPLPILGTDYSVACIVWRQGVLGMVFTKPRPVSGEVPNSSDFTGGRPEELVACAKMWGLAP